MKTMQIWLDEYSESHQNKKNKWIHYICVPAIFFSITGFLWCIPMPHFIKADVNIAATLMPLVLFLFYFRLSKIFTFIVLAMTALSLILCQLIDLTAFSLFYISVFVFIIAWIGQFIGHYIEGKKPSFFKDMQFLLIGPVWVIIPLLKKTRLKLGVDV